MKVAIILRIASLFMLVQYSAHTFLFLSRTERFEGQMFGYGVLVILNGFAEAILLWLIAALGKTGLFELRPILVLLIVTEIAHAVVVWAYFALAAPVIFDLLIAIVLVLAFVRSRDAAPTI
jgi:hypothetical protein